MLKRYTLPPMAELWTRRETKFEYWLKAELAFLHARIEIADLTIDAYEAISNHAQIDVARIDRIDNEIQHDLIAFVTDAQESLVEAGVGQYKEEFHKLLTSYDVEDPALILMLRRAIELIITELQNLKAALWVKAQEHKWTLVIADTHGQDAEPSTFGALLLVYMEAVERAIARLQQVLDSELGEGKMSGAVGNYAGMSFDLERRALAHLGLKPARAETQILQRDRHAMLLSVLAVTAGTIEQMCRTFWERMQSRMRELEEPRTKKQKGSSAMAHKKNSIITEREQGASRLVRGYALAELECIATPGWRDISQSIVERVALADATTLVHYMVVKATDIVGGMTVFTERMRHNLDEASLGVWAGQQVRNALMEAGVDYETAYRYVQKTSFEAVQLGQHVSLLFGTEKISDTDARTASDILGDAGLKKCFDAEAYIHDGIEYMFKLQKEKEGEPA